MLAALPLRWLPNLSRAWAAVGPSPRRRRIALANLDLVFGAGAPRRARRGLAREADAASGLATLRALHPRDPALGRLRRELGRLPWTRAVPAPLVVTVRYGGWPLVPALLGGLSLARHDLDALPREADDAIWLPWLGRLTPVATRALERAFAEGRSARLLLVLSDGARGYVPWASPSLSLPAEGEPASRARLALERALAALEVLVRAAPEGRDWSLPRWGWRPEAELEGHAPYSRWAPWLTPRRRGRRPAPPAR